VYKQQLKYQNYKKSPTGTVVTYKIKFSRIVSKIILCVHIPVFELVFSQPIFHKSQRRIQREKGYTTYFDILSTQDHFVSTVF
jgi:hypothetical protein